MHLSGHRQQRQQGFSLVEVMVSLAIFLIASIGLVSLLLAGIRAGQGNALHGEARRLAGESMAALQVADYAALPAFDGLSLGDGAIQVINTVENDLPEAGQTRLTVTASWHSAGQMHRYQLQAIRSRP